MPLPTVETRADRLTASTWSNVWQASVEQAFRRNGAHEGSTVLTCGDVITIIGAWLHAAPGMRARWPMWWQYAAAAYNWTPGHALLDASEIRKHATFPPSLTPDFWKATETIADELDREGVADARLDMSGDFDDVTMLAEVADAARRDVGLIAVPKARKKRRAAKRPRKDGFGLALVVGAAWLMFGGNKSRRYRRT